LCETGRAENSGVQRVSPEAQRFVYETWRRTMNRAGIDLPQVYGYDPAVLASPSDRWWFAKYSEPCPSLSYEPSHATEAMVASMMRENAGSDFGMQRQFKADFCSF
jgi:hypothetical protein